MAAMEPRRSKKARIELFVDERILLEQAADRAGMELSTWLRTIALIEARRLLWAHEYKTRVRPRWCHGARPVVVAGPGNAA
jgi:uncharacterized protein (DUF1778 family)